MIDININEVLSIVLITLAVERVTEVIVDSYITNPIRGWLYDMQIDMSLGRSKSKTIKIIKRAFCSKCCSLCLYRLLNNDFSYNLLCYISQSVHKLFTCGFCMSFWVSLLFIQCFMKTDHNFILVFVIMGLSNFWHIVYKIIEKGRVYSVDHNVTLVIRNNNEQNG